MVLLRRGISLTFLLLFLENLAAAFIFSALLIKFQSYRVSKKKKHQWHAYFSI